MTPRARLATSMGLASTVLITACSSQDDAATAMNDDLARAGARLREATACTDTCVAGPYCPGGTLQTFGVCNDRASVCCAHPDDSWMSLLKLPPMVAAIETNATMSPKPGSERGLFIEYASGGHWHLKWTCDRVVTNEACRFVVGATTDGTITDLDTNALPTAHSEESAANAFEVTTTTSTELHEVAFSTRPGAEVTLTIVDLDSSRETPLFLMQGGRINGGFKGHLSSPLRVQPIEP